MDNKFLPKVHNSPKGADARRQTTKELARSSGGAPSAQAVSGVVRDPISTATVLCGLLDTY